MARNRPSSIDRLPDDVRERLQELLRDPRVTQLSATMRINEILSAEGIEPVSKSAVNRYAVRMEEVGDRLRQSRQVAEMWIAKLGAQPGGQVGHLVNEMLRTLAFDLVLKLQDRELTSEDLPEVIDQLKQLSLSVTRLERASSDAVKRDAEVRRQAAEEAAERAATVSKRRGLSAEVAADIRREILGIASD